MNIIHGKKERKTQTTEINMYSLDAIIVVGYRDLCKTTGKAL